MDDLSMQTFSQILSVFCERPNLYILGAGASYPYSPTTSQLKSTILPQWINIGSYPISKLSRTDTFDRVIGRMSEVPYDQMNVFYWHLLRTNPNALDWMISMNLSINSNEITPTNYTVFWYLPPRSVILNFNLDQYANILRPFHVILEPHGRIPTDLRHIFSEKDIAEFIEFEEPTPWYDKTVLIRPEHYNILTSPIYDYLIRNWYLFRNVVIIGYSFSRFQYTIDDFQSFEFLCEMLKHYKNRIILIDPSPNPTAAIIQEFVGRKIIIGNLQWNQFSSILLSALKMYGIKKLLERVKEIKMNYKEAIK